MRVVRESRWELIAAHKPRWFPLALVGAGIAFAVAELLRPFDSVAQTVGSGLVAVFFVFSGYMMSTRSEFRFDAESRKVKWREQRPFATAAGVIAFSELRGVAVEAHDDSDGKIYRVVLHTAGGNVPLTRHYSTFEPDEDTQQRIANWLRAHDVAIAMPVAATGAVHSTRQNAALR